MSIGENIHNYYENLVSEALNQRYRDKDVDIDYLADIACVALNHLPPRYFRHEIDMAFYIAPSEFAEMRAKVARAVDDAIAYVDQSQEERAREQGGTQAP